MATCEELVALAHQRQEDTGEQAAPVSFMVERSAYRHREKDPDPPELELWPGGPVARVGRRWLGHWYVTTWADELIHALDGVDPATLPTVTRVCTGTNSEGGPCGRRPVKGTWECPAHSKDPDTRAGWTQTQVRGLLASQGRDRSTGEPLADLPRLDSREGRLEALQRAYAGVMAGSLPVARARLVPALVRAAAEEQSPDRLGALEAQVADLLAEVARRERGW